MSKTSQKVTSFKKNNKRLASPRRTRFCSTRKYDLLEPRHLLAIDPVFSFYPDPTGPQSGAFFGGTIANDDQHLIVGSRHVAVGHFFGGEAYVFDVVTRQYISTLRNPSPGIDSQSFGESASVSGDLALIGDSTQLVGNSQAGVVRAFDTQSGELRFSIPNPFPASADRFGYSLASTDQHIFVGTPYDDVGQSDSGTVYVFDRAGNLLTRLFSPIPRVHEHFGLKIDVGGNIVAISGEGIVFSFDETTLTYLNTLNNPNMPLGESFGADFATDGNLTVVGAETALNTGRAYVFDSQSGSLLATLDNPTPDAGDYFGSSVDVGFGTIVISAIRDRNDGSNYPGIAYGFDSTTYSLTATFHNQFPPGSDESTSFGQVAILNWERMLVSANVDYTQGRAVGLVSFFDKASGDFVETLVNPTPAAHSRFSNATAMTQDYIAIGAPGFSDGGDQGAGAVYLFDRLSGDLVYTFSSPINSKRNLFGYAVAVNGDKLIVSDPGLYSGGIGLYLFDIPSGELIAGIASDIGVGATLSTYGDFLVAGNPFDDTNGDQAGAISVYRISTLERIHKITNPFPLPFDQFGYSVSIFEDNIVVGAPQAYTGFPGSGAAYLFSATSGEMLRVLVGVPPYRSNWNFGYAVAISHDYIVVGSPFEQTLNNQNAGAVTLFDVGTGSIVKRFYAPTPELFAGFGTSVAIQEDFVVVGATFDRFYDDGAFVFQVSTGDFYETLTNPNSDRFGAFGATVAIFEDTILVGNPKDDTQNFDQGSAFLYHLPPSSEFLVSTVGEYVFYNNSKWDRISDVNRDDNAIAWNKRPLLEGFSASTANYTNYSRGINGVAIDFNHLTFTPTLRNLTSFFEFRFGNDNFPDYWEVAESPVEIRTKRGGGHDGSDRVYLTWQDGALANGWLRVKILAGPVTGLSNSFVFYFGNAIGDVGNSVSDAGVNSVDLRLVREHFSKIRSETNVSNPYDIDRNGQVNSSDLNFVREHFTTAETELKLIDLSGWGGGMFFCVDQQRSDLAKKLTPSIQDIPLGLSANQLLQLPSKNTFSSSEFDAFFESYTKFKSETRGAKECDEFIQFDLAANLVYRI